MNNRTIARQFIKAVGGRENIEKIDQCSTRLRFCLREEGKIDHDTIRQMDCVAAAFMQGKEYQILPKEGASDIYEQMCRPSVWKRLFGDFWNGL